jgi:hypothetical protein
MKLGRIIGYGALNVQKRHRYQYCQMRSNVAKAHKVKAHLISLPPTPPHLSSYQVSFSSLHFFLKIYQNFSDVLYIN